MYSTRTGIVAIKTTAVKAGQLVWNVAAAAASGGSSVFVEQQMQRIALLARRLVAERCASSTIGRKSTLIVRSQGHDSIDLLL